MLEISSGLTDQDVRCALLILLQSMNKIYVICNYWLKPLNMQRHRRYGQFHTPSPFSSCREAETAQSHIKSIYTDWLVPMWPPTRSLVNMSSCRSLSHIIMTAAACLTHNGFVATFLTSSRSCTSHLHQPLICEFVIYTWRWLHSAKCFMNWGVDIVGKKFVIF